MDGFLPNVVKYLLFATNFLVFVSILILHFAPILLEITALDQRSKFNEWSDSSSERVAYNH